MQVASDLAAVLSQFGIDAEAFTECAGRDGARVVVVQASLEEARKSLSDASRDQVIMARVDIETAQSLDRWVEVGLAKSRSEAAALFIREGLQLRAKDLAQLAAAFEDFEQAKLRLKREAAVIMGNSAKS